MNKDCEVQHIEEEAMLAQWRAEYAGTFPWGALFDEDEGGEG